LALDGVLGTDRSGWHLGSSILVTTTASIIGVAASIVLYASWRMYPDVTQGWWIAALLAATCHLVAAPRSGVVETMGPTQRPAQALLLNLAAGLAVAAMIWHAGRARRVPDPLALGLTLGSAGLLVRLVTSHLGPLPMPGWALVALQSTIALVSAATLVMVVRQWQSIRWTIPRFLVLTAAFAGANLWQSPFLHSDRLALAVACAQLLAACAVLSVAASTLGNRLARQQALAAEMSARLDAAEAADRDVRERLHEVQSTMAGISQANRLLTDERVPEDTRCRLQRSVTDEVDRLQRVLAGRAGAGTVPVDLDATIDTLLTLHRARGRTIEWEPSGAVVSGRVDDIAEVINILLENSAQHAAQATSKIRVATHVDDVVIEVADDGPGISPEVRAALFTWGTSRPGSRGQGIGLNLGQRLAEQQGGSLRLVDATDSRGATFAIVLPAARTDETTPVLRPSTTPSEPRWA